MVAVERDRKNEQERGIFTPSRTLHILQHLLMTLKGIFSEMAENTAFVYQNECECERESERKRKRKRKSEIVREEREEVEDERNEGRKKETKL